MPKKQTKKVQADKPQVAKKVFKCKECGEVLRSKGGRTLHMRQAHSQGPVCPLCDHMFSTYSNLIFHARLQHQLNKKNFTILYNSVPSPQSSKGEPSEERAPTVDSISPQKAVIEPDEKENQPLPVIHPRVLTYQ